MTEYIINLKKVTISISMTDENGSALSQKPEYFTFIYGSASEGLCPFEIAIAEKKPGDVLQLNLSAQDMGLTFGYLYQQIKKRIGLQILPEVLCFDIGIEAVTDADQREIVKAIAGTIGEGCGGDCGCGCS